MFSLGIKKKHEEGRGEGRRKAVKGGVGEEVKTLTSSGDVKEAKRLPDKDVRSVATCRNRKHKMCPSGRLNYNTVF